MSRVPITHPVLTAIIGVIGLAVCFFTGLDLFAPGLEIPGITRGNIGSAPVVWCGFFSGLATVVGCAAIYLRKRWGYRCAAAGMFLFAAGLAYKLTTQKSSPLGWLWVAGYFAMAMSFWMTGRTPRRIRRAGPRPAIPPRAP